MDNKKIVCLGGGIGTVNLIKGLKEYFKNITVVVSMADDGGSSGRLRRLYKVPPPGDLVSCMTQVIKDDDFIPKLLTYRFAGDRYGKDNDLGGQKLGNLILTAMHHLTGDFEKAIDLFQKTFHIKGDFLPATLKAASIFAKTVEGKLIYGEENIDLGKYKGERVLEQVFLDPLNIKANPKVIESLKKADVVIAGPGDLYTTVLPVLIIKEIKAFLKKSSVLKIFIVNVANKPFETKNYAVYDYIKALGRNLGFFPFAKVVVNNNFSPKIPKEFDYTYVELKEEEKRDVQFIKRDLVNEKFPLYHDPLKLAKTIREII